jgi:hypothetical protein
MGAAKPTRSRAIALVCLGLAALYVLLLVWYFPWRTIENKAEVAFTIELSNYANPDMLFCTPGGWLYMRSGHAVLCYLPPERRGQQGKLVTLDAGGPIICMAQDGNAVYYCVEGPPKPGSARQQEYYSVAQVETPPEVTRLAKLTLPAAANPDIAVNGGRVFMISERGVLTYFAPGTRDQADWRLELVPQQSPASQPATTSSFQYYSNMSITTRIVVDAAGIAYCLAAPDLACAVDTTGKELWRTKLTQSKVQTMELASNLKKLFLLEDTGDVIVLNCADGQTAWRVSGQQVMGSVLVDRMPAVGPDGSTLGMNNSYQLYVIKPDGSTSPPFANCSAFSQVLRMQDNGVLLLGQNDLQLLDATGKWRWSRSFNRKLISLFNDQSWNSECLALTPDGVAAVVLDHTLYGFKPRHVKLEPARP